QVRSAGRNIYLIDTKRGQASITAFATAGGAPSIPPHQRLLLRADCSGAVLPFLSAIRPQPISSARPDQAPHHAKKFNVAVSRLYIAPAILIMPLDSSSASTGLFLRMSVIVNSTFFCATAST